MVVWKCTLPLNEGEHIVVVPNSANFLTALAQREEIAIWFECDPEPASSERKIQVVKTGGEIGDSYIYINTVSFFGGGLIFHIYEDL